MKQLSNIVKLAIFSIIILKGYSIPVDKTKSVPTTASPSFKEISAPVDSGISDLQVKVFNPENATELAQKVASDAVSEKLLSDQVGAVVPVVESKTVQRKNGLEDHPKVINIIHQSSVAKETKAVSDLTSVSLPTEQVKTPAQDSDLQDIVTESAHKASSDATVVESETVERENVIEDHSKVTNINHDRSVAHETKAVSDSTPASLPTEQVKTPAENSDLQDLVTESAHKATSDATSERLLTEQVSTAAPVMESEVGKNINQDHPNVTGQSDVVEKTAAATDLSPVSLPTEQIVTSVDSEKSNFQDEMVNSEIVTEDAGEVTQVTSDANSERLLTKQASTAAPVMKSEGFERVNVTEGQVEVPTNSDVEQESIIITENHSQNVPNHETTVAHLTVDAPNKDSGETQTTYEAENPTHAVGLTDKSTTKNEDPLTDELGTPEATPTISSNQDVSSESPGDRASAENDGFEKYVTSTDPYPETSYGSMGSKPSLTTNLYINTHYEANYEIDSGIYDNFDIEDGTENRYNIGNSDVFSTWHAIAFFVGTSMVTLAVYMLYNQVTRRRRVRFVYSRLGNQRDEFEFEPLV